MQKARFVGKIIVVTGARLPSRASGYLTTMAYLFPRLRRSLTPAMERRGRAAKQAYLRRGAAG